MANQNPKTQRRRSLNDRLDAELAKAEDIQIAGITTGTAQHQEKERNEIIERNQPSSVQQEPCKAIPTKKATTIMPKEVFMALQRYCSETETPKHRALYLFIIEGLYAKGVIAEEELQRFREMASMLTTTYEKK